MLKTISRIKKVFRSTMTTGARYFVNIQPDYEPQLECLESDELLLNEIKECADSIVQRIYKQFKPIKKHGGDGIYLGTAGIAYMFYHLSNVEALSHKKNEYLNKAIEYIKPSLTVASSMANKKKDIPSFILGNCGVYTVASAIYKVIGDETQSNKFRQMFYDAANICKDPNFLNCGSDELFVGRAGYIMAALWLSKATNTPIDKQVISNLCKTVVESGREYARRNQSPSPLMYAYYQVEYLGAAHGLCSILQALISVPEFLDANPADAADIKESIDFLLSIQTPEGNFPATTEEIGSICELVHWCHGAGGMIYLMGKAYLTFKEEKYLDSCKLMADLIWKNGLLKKGPGICHGISGNGYAFLLLYRLTGEQKYLYRAYEFYKFMGTETFLHGSRIPDHPYSLYEGLAGAACFMADLVRPNSASFPFSDIF